MAAHGGDPSESPGRATPGGRQEEGPVSPLTVSRGQPDWEKMGPPPQAGAGAFSTALASDGDSLSEIPQHLASPSGADVSGYPETAPLPFQPTEEAVDRIIDHALSLERPPAEVPGGWNAAVRELRILGPPLHDSGQALGSRFRVVVHTGDAYGMGTTAQLTAEVTGTLSNLPEDRLRGAAAPDEQWEVFGVPVLEKLQPLRVSMSSAALAGVLQGAAGDTGASAAKPVPTGKCSLPVMPTWIQRRAGEKLELSGDEEGSGRSGEGDGTSVG